MPADIILEFIKRHQIPITREDYREINWMGSPPAELDAEEEATLPAEFRITAGWEEFD